MSAIFIQANTPYQHQDIRPVLEEMIPLEEIPLRFKYGNKVISGNYPYELLEFILRKTGHVVQYFILTLILIKTLSFIRVRPIVVLILSFILSFIIALLDEWLQRYSEGRSGQLIDVFTFDLFGIMIAIVVFLMTKKQNVKNNPEYSDKKKKI